MKKMFLICFSLVLMGVMSWGLMGSAMAAPVINDLNGTVDTSSAASGSTSTGTTGSTGSSTSSGGSCGGSFLGFKPWYSGFSCTDGGINPPDATTDDGKALAGFVWTIVLNIVFDISLAVGYLATAMVVYGGYQVIISQGDPAKAARGKKTLTAAVIGTAIAMGATVIVNTLTQVLGVSGGFKTEFTGDSLKNVFNWAYSMAGLVAVVFIIYGGISYMLAQGDPGKIQKATRSLIYAVIGLVIVILASIITGVVINTIGSNV